MPSLTVANVTHLLRRTEFVARPGRIDALMSMGSIEAAVDDILDVPASPPKPTLRADGHWEQGLELTYWWLDRMTWDSARPIQERMTLFWHGHLVSGYDKVGSAELMNEQLHSFRSGGLGSLPDLVKEISIQVAMLRYLDNNQNKALSPNQNWARELLELFLVGVGNYNERDVEAATAAWTGHSQDWVTWDYLWRGDTHDNTPDKMFLGQPINRSGTDPRSHGNDTIDVVFGAGVVPSDADQQPNRGRRTRDVAAEFLSRKLWSNFAGNEPSNSVIAAMRDAFVASGFEIRPWLRAMLVSDEFYSSGVRSGLVRSPIEFVVAMMYSLDLRAEGVAPLGRMELMGQRPMFPPGVDGWKTNGYFVNASAMGARAGAAQSLVWSGTRRYWGDGSGDDYGIDLIGGTWTRTEVYDLDMTGAEFVDGIAASMHLSLTSATRQAFIRWFDEVERSERVNILLLMFLAPEFHQA